MANNKQASTKDAYVEIEALDNCSSIVHGSMFLLEILLRCRGHYPVLLKGFNFLIFLVSLLSPLSIPVSVQVAYAGRAATSSWIARNWPDNVHSVPSSLGRCTGTCAGLLSLERTNPVPETDNAGNVSKVLS